MKAAIAYSLYASLVAQWSTLAVNGISFSFSLAEKDEILRSILVIETIVQVLELVFYSWYAVHFATVSEATFYRYHDWAITTPLMLLSTMIYYEYRNKPEEVITLESFWEKHSHEVWIVFGFNLMMLVFGYAFEIGILDLVTSTIMGFVGFAGSFYVLWDGFASKSPDNFLLYAFMFIVWALYGVAALLNSTWKNVSYNILDLVAKNFYGLFLSYLIYQKSIPSKV